MLAGLAGCTDAGAEDPTATGTDTASPTATRTQTRTDTPDRTATAETSAPTRCGPGPLPDEGWPLPDRSLGRTNYAPDAAGPTDAPSVAWSVTPPEPELGENGFTRPVVADGTLFVSRRILVGANQPNADEHYVEAYDVTTGARTWQTAVSREPNTPLVAGDLVLVDDDATLYALDAESGTARWTFDAPGGVHRVLPTPAGILVAPWRDEPELAVRALDADGGFEWKAGVPGHVNSALAWVDGLAFLITSDAVLVAIDTEAGTIAWTRDLQDGEDTLPTSLVATPCAVFASVDGVLYGVTRSGDLEWSTPVGVRELATDGRTVYGVFGDGYLRAVSAADGHQRWEAFFGHEDGHYTDGFYTDPAFDRQSLYAGTLDRKLVAVATADGTARWTLDLGWNADASVTVVDDVLFAAGGRHLVAYR